ncbi:MAG: nucleoside deaminase [Ignavibacteria bacterium]|jgi:tRNA(Arg) A34 adenosine deaminase TadA
MSDYNKKFLQKAIELSIVNVTKGGGPFGAVIVKNGKIISEGTNNVTKKNDPTAHAEIVAIRNASKKLKNYSLKGCEIYTSCEPCPMCLSAIYWANIDEIYFANTKKDAAIIGFRDDHIYRELSVPLNKRKIPFVQILRKDAIKAFELWECKTDKISY